MTKSILLLLSVTIAALTLSCRTTAEADLPQKIIAMERAALDRWGNGDPQGYLGIMAQDFSYFDPNQEKRIDGLSAMKELLAPITGKVKIDRYEMINPRVQTNGDIAVLTFNLLSHVKPPDGSANLTVRWNSTEIYGRIEGEWKLIHSHWSYIKPELKQPPIPG